MAKAKSFERPKWERTFVEGNAIGREEVDPGMALELTLPDGNYIALKWDVDAQALEVRAKEGSLVIKPHVANVITITADRKW